MVNKDVLSRALSGSIALAALTIGGVGLTATSASAAPRNAWDLVAQCESGGNWAIDTGNGYSGGLQFSPGTWSAYGGRGSAANSTRAKQIAVGRRVVAAQGWSAWGGCASRIGLSGHTDVTDAAASSHKTHKPARHRAATTTHAALEVHLVEAEKKVHHPEAEKKAHHADAKPKAHHTEAKPKAHHAEAKPKAHHTDAEHAVHHVDAKPKAHDADAKPKAHHAEAEHEVHHSPAKKAEQHAGARHAAHHVAHHTGRHVAAKATSTRTYTVKPGDTLQAIATHHHVSGGWRALADASHLAHPGEIFAGQVLHLPAH